MGHDYRNIGIGKHPISRCAPITLAQMKVLKRLNEGDILYCCWRNERCLWIPLKAIGTDNFDDDEPENKASVKALLDKDFATTDGWRYRNNEAWLLIKITDSGKTALRNN